MSPSPPTTVREAREQLRVVTGVTMADPVELGEEVARFPPKTSHTVVMREALRHALAAPGLDVCADVFSHKGIWERFAHLCIDPAWKVDPATGIILDRPLEPTGIADIGASTRSAFERDRAKREAAAKRDLNRGTKRQDRTASDH